MSAASQLRQVPWQTLSFEAQTKLGALGLPVFNSASTAPRSGAAFNSNITLDSEKEIALWIKQLASDRYLVRATALEGLAAAVRNSAIIRKVYSALKEAAANATTSIDARVAVYSLLDVARYTWLTASVNGDEPPPSPQQISQWIGVLVADKTASGDSANDSGLRRRTIQRTAAEWELLDGLTQDSSASAIKQAIERALERRDLDDDAAVRLGASRLGSDPGWPSSTGSGDTTWRFNTF